MAQFLSTVSMEFDEFDLNAILNMYAQSMFGDNQNVTVNGTLVPGFEGSYTASDVVVFWNGAFPSNMRDLFVIGGDNMVFNGVQPVSGTVTGIYQHVSSELGDEIIAVAGVSVDLVDVYAAAMTVGLADDRALLEQMLSGDDQLLCSEFGDDVFGGAGNDVISGNGGRDQLVGDAGQDTLLGGAGNDNLNGGAGNDSIAGNGGGDLLNGAGGDDRLLGQSGADRLIGGLGRDILIGGADSDRDLFIFNTAAESAAGAARDIISNFTSGIDEILLGGIDADTGLVGNQSFGFNGTSAGAHMVWFAAVNGNTIVYADTTGDAVADFSVRINGITSVAAADFVL